MGSFRASVAGSVGLTAALLCAAPVSALDLSVAAIKARPADLSLVGVSADGAGNKVGNIDDAINFNHPAFTGLTLANLDESGLGLGDFSYHSTAGASVIAGQGGGAVGVAPGIDQLINIKVNTREDVARAISLQMTSGNHLDVINLSLGFGLVNNNGHSTFTKFIDWSVNQYDYVFVKSAGNSGFSGVSPVSTTITVPGDAYNIITVGATNAAFDQVRPSSSDGPTGDGRGKPDLVAPGSDIDMARAYFADNDNVNGDFRDDNTGGANGLIGLNLSQFRQEFIPGAVFESSPGAAVTSLSLSDSDNDQAFTLNDLQLNVNWFDTNNNGFKDSGDIIRSALAYDVEDDPDMDLYQSSGTSFAAPHVAGAAALLLDYARQTPQHSTNHKTIKAVMLNGANHASVSDKSGNPWSNSSASPLHNQIGAGMLDVQKAFYNFQPAETADPADTDPVAWDNNQIAANDYVDYVVSEMLQGGTPLTATIIWDRPIVRIDDGDSLFLDDTYNVGDFADLNLQLLDSLGGVVAESLSLGDPTEHIRFLLPFDDFYTLRVMNLSAFETDFAIALLATPAPIPEPASAMLAAACLLLARRRG